MATRELKDINTDERGYYIGNPTEEEEKTYGEKLPVGFYTMDKSQFEPTTADDLNLALAHLMEVNRLITKVKQKLETVNEYRMAAR